MNYKPLSINISNAVGIDYIFYTDKLFSADCDIAFSTIMENCAEQNSLVCGGSLFIKQVNNRILKNRWKYDWDHTTITN